MIYYEVRINGDGEFDWLVVSSDEEISGVSYDQSDEASAIAAAKKCGNGAYVVKIEETKIEV